jgi:hypothetical protein
VKFIQYGLLLGLVVNSIFQPIFSYSVISNLLMAALGFIAHARAQQNKGLYVHSY